MGKLVNVLRGIREATRSVSILAWSMITGGVSALGYLASKRFECMGLEHPNVQVGIDAAHLNLTSIINKVVEHKGHIHVPAHITLEFESMGHCARTVGIGGAIGFATGAATLLSLYTYKCCKGRRDDDYLPIQRPEPQDLPVGWCGQVQYR